MWSGLIVPGDRRPPRRSPPPPWPGSVRHVERRRPPPRAGQAIAARTSSSPGRRRRWDASGPTRVLKDREGAPEERRRLLGLVRLEEHRQVVQARTRPSGDARRARWSRCSMARRYMRSASFDVAARVPDRGEVVQIDGDGVVLGAVCALDDRERAPIQPLGFGVFLLLIEQRRERRHDRRRRRDDAVRALACECAPTCARMVPLASSCPRRVRAHRDCGRWSRRRDGPDPAPAR